MSEKRKRPEQLSGTALRLLKRIWKYRLRLATACACMAVSSWAAVRGTFYLKPLVNDHIVPLIGSAISDGSLASAVASALGSGASPLAGAARLLLLMAGFYLVSMAASLVESRLMVSLGNDVLLDLRLELFDSLLRRPLDQVQREPSGALMSRFTGDMDALSNMLRRSLPYLVNGAVTCLSILVTMLSVNLKLTLVALACTAVMAPLLNWLAKRSMRHTAAQQVCVMEQSGIAKQYVEGQELVRALQMEQSARERFAQNNEALFGHAYRAAWFSSSIFSLTGGISQLGFAVLLLAGSAMALSGGADLGTVALFAQYYTSFNKPLTDMTKQVGNVLSALAGAERIFKAMDVAPEGDEGRTELIRREDGGFAWRREGRETPLRGEIALRDVAFGYAPGHRVLDGVTLTVKPGETVAILGTTGAGKTTLISLINRLYELWEGEIRVDGIPVGDIRKQSLRRAVATVSQDAHLFTGTIAENLRFGRPEVTDDQLRAALEATGADFFVDHQPQGMETVLEKAGASLSQGQRQLLTLARAAVADAPILILDEATSSIDTYTEQRVNRAFDRLMRGRTVLVIAHRLSTVRDADRIAILDKGRIAELGTPEELIARKGRYYQLVKADGIGE